MRDKVLSLLGLAAKAGKIQSGEFQAEKAIKSGKAHIAVIAADCSENTEKHFRNMCLKKGVPLYVYSTKDSLGRCIGKGSRAVIALTDAGLGLRLISELKEEI